MAEKSSSSICVYVASSQISDIGTLKSAIGKDVQSIVPLSTASKEKLQQQVFVPGSLVFIDYPSNREKIGWLSECIRQQAPAACLVVFAHQPDAHAIKNAFAHGVDDFINFGEDGIALQARLSAKVKQCKQRAQLSVKVQNLEQQVDIDDLSGLYNMRSVYRKIEGEIRRAQRYKRELSCVMMDIDYFKRVNDFNDHLFGSFCLAEVGKLVLSTIRTGMDLAARYGGDEFLVLLPETGYDGAAVFSERFRTAFANHNFSNHVSQMRLTVSVGYTSYELHESLSAEDLVRRADRALYLAKSRGRNRCEGLTSDSASSASTQSKKVAGD